MQKLMVVVIVVLLSVEYLVDLRVLPNFLKYGPEILAVVAALLVLVVGISNRFEGVRPVYFLVFGAFALVTTCGIIANGVEPGPVFAGIRLYLRALPFFFLPAVLAIQGRDLHSQLTILLGFAFLQIPIASIQRAATLARGGITGDDTFGTLMNSASLTLFLACAACILTGYFLSKRISAAKFFPLVLLLLIPTMLNESKAVLIIVPLALLTCFIIGANPGSRARTAFIGFVTISCFIAVFIPVYDYFIVPRWGYGIVDFFLMEGRLEEYLDKGAEVGEYERGAGKVGGLKTALSVVSRDPVSFAFGLGMGNVSDSALGEQYTGGYYDLYRIFLTSSGAYLIFEFGVFGIGLVLLLYWLIFRDSMAIANQSNSSLRPLAIGWSGTMVVILIGTFYHNLIDSRALSFLFWYFAGVIAAHRMRLLNPSNNMMGDELESGRGIH